MVLVGAAPGGVASNVMTYLAGGNVALSVTMTAFSTLLSPVLTPLAMQWLAGRFVPIDAWAMMISIMQMIILPIVAGLVFNRVLRQPGVDAARAPHRVDDGNLRHHPHHHREFARQAGGRGGRALHGRRAAQPHRLHARLLGGRRWG